MDITFNEICADQIEKMLNEKKEDMFKDILKNNETKNKEKVEEAVNKATEEQKKQIEKLLMQIEKLTDAYNNATEEIQKMLKNEIDLKQKVHDAEIEAQKKLNEQVDDIYKKAKKEADEENNAKIASLEKKVNDANEATETIKRKLEQGSQQLQGEIQELQLEECLQMEFPMDKIEEIEKGKPGADVTQTIVNNLGKTCGVIVWESKDVKTWKNEFISKLRNDMESVNGSVGVLVSSIFGKNMEEFTCQDGVWLIRPSNVLAMARLLRNGIIDVSKARSLAEHKDTIQDAVYEYVTSPEFYIRIENIGKQYIALKEEIYKTKVHMDRQWEKQRKMLDNLVENTQSILGDVDAYIIQSGSENRLMSESNEENKKTRL